MRTHRKTAKRSVSIKSSLFDSKFSGLHLVIFGLLFASIGLYILYQALAASPTGNTANLWIDTNGGSCVRQSIAGDYNDTQACNSFDAAWDKASSGDTIRVKAGIYGQQKVNGDKTSETKFIGEDGVEIRNNGADCENIYGAVSAFCAQAAYMTLENVVINSLGVRNAAASARIWYGRGCDNGCNNATYNAHHVTFRDVDLWGEGPAIGIDAPDFAWHGGSHGKDGYISPNPIVCGNGDGEPVWIAPSADRAVIDGIRFNVKRIDESNGCTPHVENIRLQDDTDDVVIKNNWFVAGSDAGSGHIFTGGTGARAQRVKIINNYFEPVIGSYTCQCSNGSGWIIAYNTFKQTFSVGNAATWVGNLGVTGTAPGCVGSGTRIRNIWGGSGSCGTDTFVGSTNLGIDATGHLQAGSPAINAAEAPGASDYCTGADVGGLDFEGNTRPNGAACDAGADEYGGITQPPPPPPACPAKTGDVNGDSRVDITDLSIVLSNYGQNTTCRSGDLNSDGKVTITDLSIVLSNYGR